MGHYSNSSCVHYGKVVAKLPGLMQGTAHGSGVVETAESRKADAAAFDACFATPCASLAFASMKEMALSMVREALVARASEQTPETRPGAEKLQSDLAAAEDSEEVLRALRRNNALLGRGGGQYRMESSVARALGGGQTLLSWGLRHDTSTPDSYGL